MKTKANGLSFTDRKRVRLSFGSVGTEIPMPNLIDVQRSSYEAFLQEGAGEDFSSQAHFGLREVFSSIFPIQNNSKTAELEFASYRLETPKYTVEECRQRGQTYAAGLRVTLRLVLWSIEEEETQSEEKRTLESIKEQEVYMGDIPLMTSHGTFVINGIERVVVSQMQRSPGVFFAREKNPSVAGDYLYAARVISYRGSWLDFEFDNRNVLYARIDRKRKFPATVLLRILPSRGDIERQRAAEKRGTELSPTRLEGMTPQEILAVAYKILEVQLESESVCFKLNPERYRSQKTTHQLVDADTGAILLEKDKRFNARQIKKFAEGPAPRVRLPKTYLLEHYLARDVVIPETLVVLAEAGSEITSELLEEVEKYAIHQIFILDVDAARGSREQHLRRTLATMNSTTMKVTSRDEALEVIYRILRPGEPLIREPVERFFQDLFFTKERYDLSAVGRVKMNTRLGFDQRKVPDTQRTLRKEDIVAIVRTLCRASENMENVDDIDHLGNRRVRSVGELLENQYRMGLTRMERTIKERLSGAVELDNMMPQDLVNNKPVVAAVREFFNSSQLSQFMDQTNPLSEITHKRRVSTLGPGGLTRERAGFEVRDVHATHYGRLCPIETPEGPNVGLISSLATYSKINKYGFIETPYRLVKNGRVSNKTLLLSASDEADKTIAQSNVALKKTGDFLENQVACRKDGEYMLASPDKINLMDVSPKQIVSVAASLIPFLENDDANRALMGSNMQRQAVPLLRAESPLVGTGMEAQVASDSGVCVQAQRSGFVDFVDASRIIIRKDDIKEADEPVVDIYNLRKFQRSNQDTCVNQKPLVKPGDYVQAGDFIADGPSTDLGELALGRNVLVAFMPWNGYNFEDSILISERVACEDVFTSIHIQEYDVMARDTKQGQEEITRDIPNVGEEGLRNLDESGIIYVGAVVKAGDVLVGKVTPKGETSMTPEEKLLRAIFSEKAVDVRDTSLRLPPGSSGTVVDIRVFSRRGIEKDERSIQIERLEIEKLAKDRDDEYKILKTSFKKQLGHFLLGKILASSECGFEPGAILTQEMLGPLTTKQLRTINLQNPEEAEKIERLKKQFDTSMEKAQNRFGNLVEKLQFGDDLMPGVVKMVKVFVATKRKLQAGDKMAGRHGNKGVVSRIVPVEDMPFLEDGTPVDVVLNPLGVPSRMNVGQVLETHLGWVCANLGKKLAKNLEDMRPPQALSAPEAAARAEADPAAGLVPGGSLSVPSAPVASPVTSPAAASPSSSGRTSREKAFLRELSALVGDVCDVSKLREMIKQLTEKELTEVVGRLRRGVPLATPIFDGAKESQISDLLEKLHVKKTGQSRLIDGRTGEYFDRDVTVGYIYMLKLNHLVDDKIHARSVGPYSLVTQQPLGGKAQFGGQRFGEMEVWTLEAYGAAYTLQEMLTVKSDDISGRNKAYEAIIHAQDSGESGVPESFNVLVKELRSLGLNIELL